MSLVVLLGLVIGTLPMAEVDQAESLDYDLPPPGISLSIFGEPNFDLGRGICLNLELFPSPFPSDEVEDEPDDLGALAQAAWLSARERWARRQSVRNSVAFRDVLTLCMDLGWLEECGNFLIGISVSPDSGGAFDSRLSPSRDPLRRFFGYQPAFVPLLLKSLKIRLSDRSPFEKGRKLAKLVRPWMTREQIHALFGESEAVIRDHLGVAWRYLDYGVCIDGYNNASCQDDKEPATDFWWDWVTTTHLKGPTYRWSRIGF
jgi:hypothetical protein